MTRFVKKGIHLFLTENFFMLFPNRRRNGPFPGPSRSEIVQEEPFFMFVSMKPRLAVVGMLENPSAPVSDQEQKFSGSVTGADSPKRRSLQIATRIFSAELWA
jgi:hypothetical protein